ncbi:phospholipid-binding protein MlaC [Zavarzinia sp.]|uniref:MlaC/ttg2D family ABC transporter substrate-binding protein n=1 Tax=Zavarzinia sp. TaxID=2027920 RepID=UPI00356576FC
MVTRRFLLARTGALGIALAGFALLGRPARAADPASEFIEGLGNRAISVLADKALTQADRDAKFRDLFVNAFDVSAIGQFVLGRYRRSATPEQLDEFNKLYTDDVVRTYSRRLSQYAGETLKVLGSQVVSDETVVRSQIVSPKKPQPTNVDWHLSGAAGSYKIVDVVIENLSMRSAQREDYGSVISSGGIDALLAGLRKKNAAS